MNAYHSTHRHLPQRCSYDPDGKPLLSWRVLILPFLQNRGGTEEHELYKQFRLDEPWDSEHNRKLVTKMPKSIVPRTRNWPPGKTRYVVAVGNQTVFPKADQKIDISDIQDGPNNTALASVVSDANAVVWTKPDDWEVDPGESVRQTGRLCRQQSAVLVW